MIMVDVGTVTVTVIVVVMMIVGPQGVRKNSGSHIDASHSRQPLVKGERLVRYEVNAVMLTRCQNHEQQNPTRALYRFQSRLCACKGVWGKVVWSETVWSKVVWSKTV